MKKFNVITGLPRAGSTLLCNVLNQNPLFKASSTSELPRFLSTITHDWTTSLDVKNELNRDKEMTEDKMLRTMRAYVNAWYEGDKEVVFDKSRGWSNNALMLNKLYPDAKIIVCIRDLRSVFGSVEKQHRKFPLLDEAEDAIGKTIYARADQMFSPTGLIGAPIVGIEDLLRRQPEGIIFLKYEDFTKDPEKEMKRVYEELGEPYFEHNYKDVKNTAIDPDGFYLWKYPHKGEGEIKEGDPEEYKKYLSPDLAKTIMDRFSSFNKFFNYN
jgi:sulfotransferase